MPNLTGWTAMSDKAEELQLPQLWKTDLDIDHNVLVNNLGNYGVHEGDPFGFALRDTGTALFPLADTENGAFEVYEWARAEVKVFVKDRYFWFDGEQVTEVTGAYILDKLAEWFALYRRATQRARAAWEQRWRKPA